MGYKRYKQQQLPSLKKSQQLLATNDNQFVFKQETLALASMARDDSPASSTASSTVANAR